MPGKVIKLYCAEGDSVKAGDSVVVIEAMKMEHVITAPCDG
jgi:acetyl-CoA/propionyl-CoA carboxylase biotin carboxyl carrier protein